MAAKGISTGIEHLVRQKKDEETVNVQLSKKWKSLRNQIDVILLSNKTMRSADTRQKCLVLDNLTPDTRIRHITDHWGPLYLERVTPLLQQLATVEAELTKHTS